MRHSIIYHEDVIKKDLPHLTKSVVETVYSAIEKKLVTYPVLFGKPLRGLLRRLYKLRVGNYRIVFSIHNDTIHILAIIHRSRVYKEIEKRI